MLKKLSIIQPDDWHCHLRDEQALKTTVSAQAKQFARSIIMPNLTPPVTSVSLAQAYYHRILEAVPKGYDFTPLMTLYLTDQTTPADIEAVANSKIVHALKLYPANATTNSAAGVTQLEQLDAVFAQMAEANIPLLIHGEVTDANIDIFDREKVFIEQQLIPLKTKHPKLKVVLEHITTQEAVEYVLNQDETVAATITAHHLLYNRNAILVGGIKPHYYCLPVLKREHHRQALLSAATSGSEKFFLGTDSAPHTQNNKESACGCAGIYTAFAAIELYAEAFTEVDALERLENFASIYGPKFYGLPINQQKITLIRQPWTIADSIPYLQDQQLIPLKAGESLKWQLDIK